MTKKLAQSIAQALEKAQQAEENVSPSSSDETIVLSHPHHSVQLDLEATPWYMYTHGLLMGHSAPSPLNARILEIGCKVVSTYSAWHLCFLRQPLWEWIGEIILFNVPMLTMPFYLLKRLIFSF